MLGDLGAALIVLAVTHVVTVVALACPAAHWPGIRGAHRRVRGRWRVRA